VSNSSTTVINEPLVSVVMATYNGERFIPKQLESILSQTYQHLEVIIVDDGSTDRSYSILEDYAAKDQRIRLYKNEKNLGYVKNFERGLSLAKGDYIAPSDQDDVWLSHKIQFLLDRIGTSAVIYANSALIDEDGELMGKKLSDVKRLATFNDCLNYTIGNSAPGHGMLLKKEIVTASFPLPTMIPHDYWLGFVATFYSELTYVDEVLVLYRQHGANVFGAAKVKSDISVKPARKQKTNSKNIQLARERMRLMYEKCPADLIEQKKVFQDLCNAYSGFSLLNNWNRMIIFFRYNERMLAFKQRSLIRRWLFCLKMFVKIK
jgi:glycosyltransferase involved in cell wall biosynthesis